MRQATAETPQPAVRRCLPVHGPAVSFNVTALSDEMFILPCNDIASSLAIHVLDQPLPLVTAV